MQSLQIPRNAINNPSAKLTLVYVDDVVEHMIRLLDGVQFCWMTKVLQW